MFGVIPLPGCTFPRYRSTFFFGSILKCYLLKLIVTLEYVIHTWHFLVLLRNYGLSFYVDVLISL